MVIIMAIHKQSKEKGKGYTYIPHYRHIHQGYK